MALVLIREEARINDLASMDTTLIVTYTDTTTGLDTTVVIDGFDAANADYDDVKAAINAEVPGLVP